MKKEQTHTKGNVIVENIRIGDIHYEYEMGMGVKCKVITLPVRGNDGVWSWQSESSAGRIIDYLVTEGLSHYSPNLYDYEAYTVKHYI